MPRLYSGGSGTHDWTAKQEQQLQKLFAQKLANSGGSWNQDYPPGGGAPQLPGGVYIVDGSGGGFKMPGN